MNMFGAASAAKRIKLSKENECSIFVDAESGFHSEIDFSASSTAAITSETDISLSPAKRKVLATRRASLQSISLSSSNDLQHQFSSSSGYASLFSSSTSGSSSLSLSRSSSSRTPKKRKSEVSQSDENFYNSFQFISPLKIRKKDDKNNCAKLVLKEKSSSENVILSSTPIHTNANKNKKWEKFRSFHPEKLKFGKSLDDAEPIQKLTNFGVDNSLNLSSFDFSNTSLNLTPNIQQQQNDIPTNIQNLWKGDIVKQQQPQQEEQEQKSQVSNNNSILLSSSIDSSISNERKKFFNGIQQFNIVGKLHAKRDIAVGEILSYLDDESLHNLSYVSKDYRDMIKSNKLYELKLQNYLREYKAIKENKISANAQLTESNLTASEKKRKKPLGNYNRNQKMVLRKKSPLSSEKDRFYEMNQDILSCKKCPRCRRPATINKLKIRNSPRKKKYNILGISSTGSSRVQKRSRAKLATATFLSKTSSSISDSFHEAGNNRNHPMYVTLPNFDDDDLSKSPNRSSSCESPNSASSSDEMELSLTANEIYEYGECTGIGCRFKFCVKCNCKYHPKQMCGDLSPPSPSRAPKIPASACTRASLKSLKRLAY